VAVDAPRQKLLEIKRTLDNFVSFDFFFNKTIQDSPENAYHEDIKVCSVVESSDKKTLPHYMSHENATVDESE